MSDLMSEGKTTENPVSEEDVVVVQDNPMIAKSSAQAGVDGTIEAAEAPTSAGETETKKVKKVVKISPIAEPTTSQDENEGFSTKLAARESALCAHLGTTYDENESVLGKAVAAVKSGTCEPIVTKLLKDVRNEITRALGETVTDTDSERKATARWQGIGGAVIATNKANNLMQSLIAAKKWEPKEGTIAHKIITIVRKPNFQYAMTVNVILTGIVHGMVATSWAREDKIFENVLYVFDLLLIMSSVEFLAVSFTFSWRTLLDGWNGLEAMTLGISWLVIFLGNPYWSFGVTRTFRLTRQFESSKILVEGFVMALPSILWVFLIIFINICVFTVIGVQFFREKSPEQYGDLRTGLYTSFKLMTLENWTDEAETLRQAYKYGSAYFILFITTNSFILLNLLIATVVDLIREIGQKKEQRKLEKRLGGRRTTVGSHVSQKITNPFFKAVLPQSRNLTVSKPGNAPGNTFLKKSDSQKSDPIEMSVLKSTQERQLAKEEKPERGAAVRPVVTPNQNPLIKSIRYKLEKLAAKSSTKLCVNA